MDYLSEMALFVEVANAMSFSRAAAKLAMPQSTLSRRISALERALGVPLLHRTTRKIELTESGRRYLQRAVPLVEEARLVHAELHGQYALPGGVLRLSLPVDFAYEFLAPLLPPFATQFPDIELELDVTPRRVDLIAEPFDLVVRAGKLPDSGLVAHLLMRVPRCLYAAPGYLAAQGAPQTPAELAAHRCLRFQEVTQWQLFAGETTTEVAISGAYRANSLGLLQRLAVAGMGIALLPEIGVREDVAAARLQRVLPDWQASAVPVYALTASRLLPAKSRCFIDFLTAHAPQ